MAKASKITIRLELFSDTGDDIHMLLRPAGGGVASHRQSALHSGLTKITGVAEVLVTRSIINIVRLDDAGWQSILPSIKRVLFDFFGQNVNITTHILPCIPERTAWMLFTQDMLMA